MVAQTQPCAPAPYATDLWCAGPILEAVQRAMVFEDSKDFVDSPLRAGVSQEEVGSILAASPLAARAPDTPSPLAGLAPLVGASAAARRRRGPGVCRVDVRRAGRRAGAVDASRLQSGTAARALAAGPRARICCAPQLALAQTGAEGAAEGRRGRARRRHSRCRFQKRERRPRRRSARLARRHRRRCAYQCLARRHSRLTANQESERRHRQRRACLGGGHARRRRSRRHSPRRARGSRPGPGRCPGENRDTFDSGGSNTSAARSGAGPAALDAPRAARRVRGARWPIPRGETTCFFFFFFLNFYCPLRINPVKKYQSENPR